MASITRRGDERAKETARLDREGTLERRSIKRLRSLVAVFAIAALVAASLTIIAKRESDRAGRESRIATARELAAAAVANVDVDAERAVLLAIQAIRTTRDADGTFLPEAEEALHRAIVASTSRDHCAGPRRKSRLEPQRRVRDGGSGGLRPDRHQR
jgi:hypothetical protein